MYQMDLFSWKEEAFQGLYGKNVCITGTLRTMNRKEAFDTLLAAGATPNNNVTRETDYLVVGVGQRIGNKDGRKSQKERKALSYQSKGSSIQIIYEKELLTLLKNSGCEIRA